MVVVQHSADRCIAAAFDAFSQPFSPDHPPILFDGMTGGEAVTRVAERHICTASESASLRDVLEVLDSKIKRRMHKDAWNPTRDSGTLAGACFAVARIIGNGKVELAQCGDAHAIIETRDGGIISAPNHVWRHEVEMENLNLRLRREAALDIFVIDLEQLTEEQLTTVRGEMWNRFRLPLQQARSRDINNPASSNGYGILNGLLTPCYDKFVWQTEIPVQAIRTILLVTDGMIPWWGQGVKASDQEIGMALLKTYYEQGIAGLLIKARETESKTAATNLTKQAEATAIAIRFA